MKKILGELLLLLIAGIIGFFIIRGIMNNQSMQKNTTVLSGQIVKETLTLSSPAYGEITRLPISQGQYITKGTVLAVIKVLSHGPDSSAQSTNVFRVYQDTISIISPVDGTVANVTAAENSTINPQNNFITIYPINKTTVSIFTAQNDVITHYKNFIITTYENTSYPLVLLHTYPVTTNNNQLVYFATLKNAISAKDFSDGQKINISATKVEGKLQSPLMRVEDFISSEFTNIKKTM